MFPILVASNLVSVRILANTGNAVTDIATPTNNKKDGKDTSEETNSRWITQDDKDP